MKTLLFLLALTTGMFFACKNNSGVKEETNLSVEHHDAVKQNHDDHPSHATKVTLNAGNKWQANAETTEGIGWLISTGCLNHPPWMIIIH